jgi:hypothetical protein
MSSAPAIRLVPDLDSPTDVEHWEQALCEAFEDTQRDAEFLPLAEEALRACPTDSAILCLAATAALLDGRAERALVFLKRLSKRYIPGPSVHLLHALALAQQNKLAPARLLLERHDLYIPYAALRVFPGGRMRSNWLIDQLARIRGQQISQQRPRTGAGRATSKAAAKPRAGGRPRKTPAAPTADSTVAQPPALPQIDVDIPFTAEFDLGPLLAATRSAPDSEGRLYRLRQQLAHLGLAQGFDELLCLPQLHGI